MSDQKFACRHCGQHIAADPSWAGKQIQCPTCGASVVVPTPASTTSALPPVIPRSSVTAPARSAAKSPLPVMGIVLTMAVLFVIGTVAVGVIGYRFISKARKHVVTTPPPPPRAGVSTQPTLSNSANKQKDPKVTTDPRAAEIPDSPVAGLLRGVAFKPDAAVINGHGFQLKQGNDFIPDASLNFFLFLKPQEKLEGRTIVVTNSTRFYMKPHIHVGRKEEARGVPRTEIVSDNYVMRLEFGERQGEKLPGRIYLELSESLETKVAGTFEASYSK